MPSNDRRTPWEQDRDWQTQMVLGVCGDEDGSYARAELRAYYSSRVVPANELTRLDPEAVAAALTEGRDITARAFCTAMQAWCSALLTALDHPIHRVK